MAQKKKKKKTNSKKNEIIGIVIIGIAVFAAITVYLSIDSVFGNFIKDIIFGLFGVLGYIVPVLIGAVGVLVIAARKKSANVGKLVLIGITLWLVFSLVHISVAEKVYGNSSEWNEFIAGSFEFGKANIAGGGAVGSLLVYWTYRFLRLAGSYIVCIVGLVACIILLTNLSIKQISKDLGTVVKTSYDGYRTRAEEKREKKRLYVENLEMEEHEIVERERENQFDLRIRSFDDSVHRKFEEMNSKEDVNDVGLEYNPKPYRELFEGTDIKFQDDIKPEIKKKRRIDLSQSTLGGAAGASLEPRMDTRSIDIPPIENEYIRNEEDALPEEEMEVVEVYDDFEEKPYVKPPLNLLTVPEKATKSSAADLKKNVEILERTLLSFNVDARVVNVSHGPVVTRYEVQPASGVKVSKIVNLADDIAMNLSARDVRIEAPVPGKPVVGIEIPNSKRTFVGIRELLATEEFRSLKSPIAFALGKDIAGSPVFADIAKMPHLLIAGATGAGKSVCINSLIVSILFHSSPEDVKMIMIDPKVVELNAYNSIPHLLIPVVTEPKKAASAINWAVNEMTMRYRMFAKRGAKDLAKYNEAIMADGEKKLPQILVIVDELADLMMVASREVEEAICRIAQLGRASGIHLVIATQRPSVDVITGIIKANIPSRIAFAVSSQIDSRTILDMQGAEKLVGQGDMLFYPAGMPKPIRLQGCFISEKEVDAVTEFLKVRTEVAYDERVIEGIAKESASATAGDSDRDVLFMQAAEMVVSMEQASVSMLQRKMKIGYARAGRLMDQLEDHGIVSQANGSKSREVLISRETLAEMQAGEQLEEEF